jgi:hypothetical protein
MYSIRNAVVRAIVPVAALVSAGAGCQRVMPPPSMVINPAPIVIDEAMQRRDWDESTAYYTNGVTVAGPTGIYFESDPRLPLLARGAIDTPLFVGHTIALPFDFIWDPPWKDVAYPRAQAPASYTAVPPSTNEY